ncbi:hypothetical protein J4E06_05615 [Muricauda sp. NFXS6]|uniref:hypothetical protein n=1 Tax=Allomuricauda sp. NFXS6 TaxID=2819094 RepID=UPI0032DF6885
MIDSEIEKLLNEINESEVYNFKLNFENYEDEIIYRKSINHLERELKLIRKPFENEAILELTHFGKRVIKKGGWIEYSRIESEKEKRSDKKDIFDFKVSKYRYHTFWWFFAFATLGSGLSIFNFVKGFSPSEKNIQLEKRIEKMELEMEKSRTSKPTQKNTDSLTKSNTIENNQNQ